MSAPSPPTIAKLLGLLGLAQRAGKLAVGATAVEGLIHRGRRPVVIVAEDAGSALLRRLQSQGPERCVLVRAASRHELGKALGRDQVAAVAVTDRGFVNGIVKLGLVQTSRPAPEREGT